MHRGGVIAIVAATLEINLNLPSFWTRITRLEIYYVWFAVNIEFVYPAFSWRIVIFSRYMSNLSKN